MIKKIDIKKFGLFNDFQWDNTVGKEKSFKKLNIIYGRNYSGKTTLARIFRCVEDEIIHCNYLDADFTIYLNDNRTITSDALNSCKVDLHFRIYNTDFVNKNLSWLHKEDGTIEPFTILGSINVELENKIKNIKEKIGSEEDKSGLAFLLSEKTKIYDSKVLQYNSKNEGLENKLKSKANNEIKINSALFLPSAQKKTYQINDIKSEIELVIKDLNKFLLSDSAKEERRKILNEKTLPDIKKIIEVKPSFGKNVIIVEELIGKKITPNKPIADLINDTLLQLWVRQGIEHHKNKRTTCGFCGSVLPSDLWHKLDAHFNKESEDLRQAINSQIDILTKSKNSLSEFMVLRKEMFYSSLQEKYNQLNEKWNTLINIYLKNIDFLINALQSRFDDIFNTKLLVDIKDNSEEILEFIKSLNILIDENNRKVSTLQDEQQKIRRELRLSTVAQFVIDIDYNATVIQIESLKKEVKSCEEEKNKIQDQINLLNEEKRSLERQVKDESRGAELVNQHLSNFFGHDELKLVSEGESPNLKFKITRGIQDAKNLSEGECSLISFCYFIAKMEDEMQDEANNQKLIIYIDDPISSLDSNHIFFMYSLIDTILAKSKKYGQLFISTHNLDFLKFLKRITVPDGDKENIAHFLIERRQKQNDKKCLIIEMPSHLRDFVTEFNYLFNEIYKVHKECKGDKSQMVANTYNQFYNLPNNIRKFLECYLFFKYPNSNDLNTNLNKLFDDHVPCLINRIVNEYSHLTYIDRGWKPIDVDEAEQCATIIINKVKEKDPEQFQSLISSVK